MILLTEHGQDPFSQLGNQYRERFELAVDSSCASDQAPTSSSSDSDSESKSSDDDCDDDEHTRVVEYIRKHKRYPNTENLFNLLDFLYKLIVYKLVPTSETPVTAGGDSGGHNADADETPFNVENDLVDFLQSDSVDLLGYRDRDGAAPASFRLIEFNLEKVKLKHIYQVWKCLVKIFGEISK